MIPMEVKIKMTKVKEIGLAMRRFLLMRIDAHQMRIDAQEPHH